MCSTTDGFKIADEDLKLRGPGDFMGHRQHGLPELKIADLSSDMELLRISSIAAQAVINKDPDLSLPIHKPLKEAVDLLLKNSEN
jgi:ATP-dependent DNA helicase RecG